MIACVGTASNGGRATSYRLSDSFQEVTAASTTATRQRRIRPEIRYDWTNESAGAQTLGFNQTEFGIDAVVTF